MLLYLEKLKVVTYAYLNVFCHHEQISILLEQTNLDILLLGETILNSSVLSEFNDVPGYTYHKNDRDAGSGLESMLSGLRNGAHGG